MRGLNYGDRNDHTFASRRLAQYTDISACENEVARLKRLKPSVMLVSLAMGADEDHALLLSLRCVCPVSYIVLLADDAVSDCQIFQAWVIGARGYLKRETARLHISKAVQVVGRGEAWVPRKMLGSIMDRVLN